MTHYDLIANRFADTLQAVAEQVDVLAPTIERAASLLSETLLQEGKLILCGLGPDAAAAQLMASYLISRFDLERPALPALNLAQGSSITTSVIGLSGSIDLFSRQIKALGRNEDLLICIANQNSHPALLRAIQTAHDQGIPVVAITNGQLDDIDSLLTPGDVNISINAERNSTVMELQIMCIHRLLELLEESLFFTNTGTES
jgi:D-sedoheptulose 7-phosphate isomerase